MSQTKGVPGDGVPGREDLTQRLGGEKEGSLFARALQFRRHSFIIKGTDSEGLP